MALPIIFNLPRRRQRPQTGGGGGGGAAYTDKDGEGNQMGGGRQKKRKKKITQASRPAATKGGGEARGPIRKMLLSAGSGASPRLTAMFCLFFPLMALATHAKAFVCPSCHFISILSTTKCRYLRRVSAG